jgi:hypothetical protein
MQPVRLLTQLVHLPTQLVYVVPVRSFHVVQVGDKGAIGKEGLGGIELHQRARPRGLQRIPGREHSRSSFGVTGHDEHGEHDEHDGDDAQNNVAIMPNHYTKQKL